MQQALDELERVLELTLPDRPLTDHSRQVSQLDVQEQRLRQCQREILREREELGQFRQYLEGEQLSLSSRIPTPHLPSQSPAHSSSDSFQRETVDQVEL